MKNKPQKPKGARKGLTRLAPGKEGCSTRQLLVGGAGGFTVKETVWEPVFRSWETQARYQSCHSCLYVKTETCAAFPIQPLWEQKTGGEEDAQVCLSLRCWRNTALPLKQLEHEFHCQFSGRGQDSSPKDTFMLVFTNWSRPFLSQQVLEDEIRSKHSAWHLVGVFQIVFAQIKSPLQMQ